jgi:hypothetical protein
MPSKHRSVSYTSKTVDGKRVYVCNMAIKKDHVLLEGKGKGKSKSSALKRASRSLRAPAPAVVAKDDSQVEPESLLLF